MARTTMKIVCTLSAAAMEKNSEPGSGAMPQITQRLDEFSADQVELFGKAGKLAAGYEPGADAARHVEHAERRHEGWAGVGSR
jgi:hypothetical protein